MVDDDNDNDNDVDDNDINKDNKEEDDDNNEKLFFSKVSSVIPFRNHKLGLIWMMMITTKKNAPHLHFTPELVIVRFGGVITIETKKCNLKNVPLI